MAEFTVKPVQSPKGFTAAGKGKMPTQLVETGGSRGFLITGAKDIDFRIDFTGGRMAGMTWSETENKNSKVREIWIETNAPGTYTLEFSRSNSGFVAYFINIIVVNERKIDVAFAYLPGMTNRFVIKTLVDTINDIWLLPAAVSVREVGTFTNDFGKSFNVNEPKIDLRNIEHLKALTEYNNPTNANWLVYFVWGIKNEGRTVGLTGSGKTIINYPLFKKSESDAVGRTLAHELGHLICSEPPRHDTQSGDLMLEVSAKHHRNTTIRLPRALLVGRR